MMYKRRIIWLFLFLCFVHTTSFTQEYSLLQMYSSAQRILREGVSNGDVDKIQEALILFNRSLEINPNYFDVLKDLSIGYFMLGDMHLARTYMESALRQNSEDTNLRILKIFLDMKDGDLKIAKDQIDEISRRFPLKIEVAYLQMMYAALLNDRDKIDEIYSSMISRFGNDNRFVYLFTVIQSLEDKKISFEQDSIVNEIDLLYPQQPWVQWLLAEYNFASKNSEAEQRIVDYLLTVKIPELEKYAQQRRFINAFNQKDYLQATSYAEDYTEKYPREIKSWIYLGLAYYNQKQYRHAERALSRAREIDPNSYFLQFIYDTVLRQPTPLLDEIKNERLNVILESAQNAFDVGETNRSALLLNEVLYIDPTSIEARRLKMRIAERERNFYTAFNMLKDLIKKGYSEPYIDELYDYYEEKARGVEVTFGKFKERADVYEKVWNMELGEIRYGSNDAEKEFLYDPFIRKLFLYNFSQSQYINWNTQYPRGEVYEVSIDFSEREDNTFVTVTVRNKARQAVIFTFNKVYIYGDFYARIAYDIGEILDSMVPKIAEIVDYDRIGRSLLINIFQASDIETDVAYAVYPNKTTYNFELTQENELHLLENEPREGDIIIKEKSEAYAIGKIERSEGVENEALLNLIQNVKVGDFILVTPVPWNEIAKDNLVLQSLKSQAQETRMSYYFTRLYFLEIFFQESD